MNTFTIEGNKLRCKMWKSLSRLVSNKVKKHESSKVDISNIIFPTPSSLIIKYTILNTKHKYELILQGNYIEMYKKVSGGENITPDIINAPEIIRQRGNNAYRVN